MPLDNSAATPPALGRTWFLALVKSMYMYVRTPASQNERGESEEEGEDATDSASDVGNGVRPSKGRMAATMAGGRRRKAVKRR